MKQVIFKNKTYHLFSYKINNNTCQTYVLLSINYETARILFVIGFKMQLHKWTSNRHDPWKFSCMKYTERIFFVYLWRDDNSSSKWKVTIKFTMILFSINNIPRNIKLAKYANQKYYMFCPYGSIPHKKNSILCNKGERERFLTSVSIREMSRRRVKRNMSQKRHCSTSLHKVFYIKND